MSDTATIAVSGVVPELGPGYPSVADRTKPPCVNGLAHTWGVPRDVEGGILQAPGVERTSVGCVFLSHCMRPGCRVTCKRFMDFGKPGKPEGDYYVYDARREAV
ncbi:MAG: hypothetical protein J4F28_02080 [Nitrosopumilaceae archaeon]|nr:hypothetical protein [Nitrosopumilaceae archaeon]